MAELTAQEQIDQIWEMFKASDARLRQSQAEWDRRFAETEALRRQSQAELDRRFAETSDEIKATNRGLRQLEGLFGNQWGRLIEALVKPGVLALFQQRGHKVTRIYENATARVNGYIMEIDIILEDSVDIIVIEVKSRLSVDDVNDFLADLDKFLVHFPRFAGYQIYGAVAALEVPQDVARYAYRRGLYVVEVSGDDMVQMLNDAAFRPRQFNPEIEG
ncbi:MAG: hypothetical protein R3A44_35615 [Caldilineaceae bacterium]